MLHRIFTHKSDLSYSVLKGNLDIPKIRVLRPGTLS